MAEVEMKLSREQWKSVQSRLKDIGLYVGLIDGLRGPLTDNAIVAFKRSIGFRARPFFGVQTYNALIRNALPPMPGDPMPPWMDHARAVLGLHERRDKNKLVSWFKGIVPDWVDPREISWCGAFVATCLLKWRPGQEVPQNILGARQWGAFGRKSPPWQGCIGTFWRIKPEAWQGHVGFLIGENATAYRVRGGNQSDAVTDTWIAKNRLLQTRWPVDYPDGVRLPWINSTGILSTNEA